MQDDSRWHNGVVDCLEEEGRGAADRAEMRVNSDK